jgi:hypothetical protein
LVCFTVAAEKQQRGGTRKEGKKGGKKNSQIFPSHSPALWVPKRSKGPFRDEQIPAGRARVDRFAKLVLAADEERQREDRGEAGDLKDSFWGFSGFFFVFFTFELRLLNRLLLSWEIRRISLPPSPGAPGTRASARRSSAVGGSSKEEEEEGGGGEVLVVWAFFFFFPFLGQSFPNDIQIEPLLRPRSPIASLTWTQVAA